jgi:hypothetical protein
MARETCRQHRHRDIHSQFLSRKAAREGAVGSTQENQWKNQWIMTHTSEIDDIPPSQVDQVVQDFKDAGAASVTKQKQDDGNFTVLATFNDGAGETPGSGHMVTVDPPFSVTGRATMFGLNYNGSIDTGDNGMGFFMDPGTGKTYNTRMQALRGCSLPREVMLSTFLSIDSWKTAGIDPIWARNSASVQEYVTRNKPLLTIDSGGKTAGNVPLVDAGPTAETHNSIDLTFAVAHELKTNGAALATYEILVADTPLEIKGWNFKTRQVG